MIDYYLHKKCSLMAPSAKQKENIRCNGCVWFDKKINRCIFSINYPKQICLEDFKQRIENVNEEQQNNLSEPFRRFEVEAKK